jgi:SAM-dependent methyltransferase
MANIVLASRQDAEAFTAGMGRGLHARNTAHLDTITQHVFREVVRMPRPASTFIDLGCGSGEALLQALRMGFERPVVGIDWDKRLLADDTKEKLQSAGFESRRDFVLLAADIRDQNMVTTSQNYLRSAGYPTAFDVVYCQQVMLNTPPPLRPRVVANCIAMGKAGGTLHLSVGPLYPPQALPSGELAQRDPNPASLVPNGSLFTVVDHPTAREDTRDGLKPVQQLTAAITVAPGEQWAEAETQARAELAAAHPNAAAATMLRIGHGREFGLAAGPPPPSPSDTEHKHRPYGFTRSLSGYADWSAHWTNIALRRRECNQIGQTTANRTWNAIDQAGEMAMDILMDASKSNMVSALTHGGLAVNQYTVKCAPVEVMATMPL